MEQIQRECIKTIEICIERNFHKRCSLSINKLIREGAPPLLKAYQSILIILNSLRLVDTIMKAERTIHYSFWKIDVTLVSGENSLRNEIA